MTVIASLAEVTKRYLLGNVDCDALRGVTLGIRSGAFIAFAGPSGSGKTTLLNLLGCLDAPTEGEVWVAGTRPAALTEHQRAELRLKTIGFVFQRFNLMSALSVNQNVALPLLLQGCGSQREQRERVQALLEQVGLAGLGTRNVKHLSGGQRQRVAIARALVGRPRLVLVDEPTANLDVETGRAVLRLFRELNEAEGTTFVFSTHDPELMRCADEVVYLEDGKVVHGR